MSCVSIISHSKIGWPNFMIILGYRCNPPPHTSTHIMLLMQESLQKKTYWLMEFFLHQLICKISRFLGRILYIPGGFLAGFLNHQLYQNPTIPLFSSFDSRNHVESIRKLCPPMSLNHLWSTLAPQKFHQNFRWYVQRFSQSRRKLCVKV